MSGVSHVTRMSPPEPVAWKARAPLIPTSDTLNDPPVTLASSSSLPIRWSGDMIPLMVNPDVDRRVLLSYE